MAADIAQVMRILRYREVDVRVVDDRLVAKYRRGALPQDMHSFIVHFRDQIIEWLTQEAATSAACMAKAS